MLLACASLVLMFVKSCDDNQLCLCHSASGSLRPVIFHVLEIFCLLFYCVLADLHAYQASVCFEGDSSSGFTIKETLEVVMLWAYAALRRVCPQVFKVSSYFANIL